MSAALWWLLLAIALRLYLVHEWRLRRVNEIHFYNMAWLYREQSGHIDTSHYRKLGSARAMLLDLRRWTYRSFYPEVLDPDTRIRIEREVWLAKLMQDIAADERAKKRSTT